MKGILKAAARALTLALIGCMPLLAAALEINQADRAQLESIKGVGTTMSESILAERQKSEFKDWPDFMSRVKGVKGLMARRLSNAGLTVNGAALPVASFTRAPGASAAASPARP